MILAQRNLLASAAFILTALGSELCSGQNTSAKDDSIKALAGKWDIQCSERGCLMFTDVLVGDPDHPADFKNPEYITIAAAIDRTTRKPAYIAFHVPSNADRTQGVMITFSKTLPDGVKWKMELDTEGASRLPFESCDQDSCVARVRNGIITDGKDSHKTDLLDKFLNSNHILFLYMHDGQPYRTIKPLFPFQAAFKQLLETELKKSN